MFSIFFFFKVIEPTLIVLQGCHILQKFWIFFALESL